MKSIINKKNIIYLVIISILILNIVIVFLWQFTYATDNYLVASGGTLSSESTIEEVINSFGGVNAVNVIKNNNNYKVILKSNILLNNTINIISGNYTIVNDEVDRVIKRNIIDDNNDYISDFNSYLFNVENGSLSIGIGDYVSTIDNISNDDILSNYMTNTLSILGNNEINGGYINDLSGNSIKPSITSSTSLINVENGTLNMWGNSIIGSNYSSDSCISLNNNSVFNMYDGVISKCVSNSTGSVLDNNNSTFNMYGGEIINNEVLSNGVINSVYSGVVNINGGIITHNMGDGISISNGLININGGFIYDNYYEDLELLSSSIISINNGYIESINNNEIGNNTISINNGVVNNVTSNNGVSYNGSTDIYGVTILDGSSISSNDYVRIYDEYNNEVMYYEGVINPSITSLKFYLPNGRYHAYINENKTYYFVVNNSDLVLNPSGIEVINETFGSNLDGSINGLSSNMEMSFDGENYFELPSYPLIENVPAGVYYIRNINELENYVMISVKGTSSSSVSSVTLTKDTNVEVITEAFGGIEAVDVLKNNDNYTIILKNNIYSNNQFIVNSGNYNIISDGGVYTIKRDITSYVKDMFVINGGSLVIGKSNVINDNENTILYSFDNEELISNINEEVPDRSNDYINSTKVLVGINNMMSGSITIDGGSVIESGFINGGTGLSTSSSPVSGVLFSVLNGSLILNSNVHLTNNYNSGDRIEGSAINVSSNGILKIYGGSISKCVRYNSNNTYGSAIYNKGNGYIYNVDISNNEVSSNGNSYGTIYNEGNMYITNINMVNNVSKYYGGGIYSSNNSNTFIYGGRISNNIRYNNSNTSINDDIYINNQDNNVNILNGIYGYIYVNGNVNLKIIAGNIINIDVLNSYNDVTLYPLVKLINTLNVSSNSDNDIRNSISNELNYINLTNESISTFNSLSTLNISFYHEYNNLNNYERYLVFNDDLPIGTSIILRRTSGNIINTYYYKNSEIINKNTPIYLSLFKELGTTTSFVESENNSRVVETIDLIISFEYNGLMTNGMVSYYCGNNYASASYIIDDSDIFSIGDFTIDNSVIKGGLIISEPALYSNYYYGKHMSVILSVNNGTNDIPFIIKSGENIYKSINNKVILNVDSLDNLTILNGDYETLDSGNYTLLVSLSMTMDNRIIKYSALDGIVLSKSSNFTVINRVNYGLNINSNNERYLEIDEENNGVFNFNIDKNNLNGGIYLIKLYKKIGNLSYSNMEVSNVFVSENNSILNVTLPVNIESGNYKMIISYVVNEIEVVKDTFNVIIK